MKKKKKEDQEINIPVKNFFEKKRKCNVSRREFKFSDGKIDVLAYDRENKSFHICEGKRASNIASVGHAIGQLVAYFSMIQENGYNFLNKVSKQEHLDFSDFRAFFEEKAINVCFYIALPEENKKKLLNPTEMILKRLGILGKSIGVFFASKNNCELKKPAIYIPIKIRRIFTKQEFLDEVRIKFLASNESKGLVKKANYRQYLIQFKEKKGNSNLHYEVCIRKQKKMDKNRLIEVALHLEYGPAHLKNKRVADRKKNLQKVLSKAHKALKKKNLNFKYQSTWGESWSRLYILKSTSTQFDEKILDEVLVSLKKLVSASKPLLNKINWGRQKRKKEDFE